jgi:plasmid stabilization system protein ParE
MLRLRREAERDIKAAYKWYEEKRPNLGKEFIEEIELRIGKIGENPDLYVTA